MSKIDSVLRQELGKISLSDLEIKRMDKIAKDFISKVKADLNISVGGSLAKRTLIRKDKQDIDLFVVFKTEKEMSKIAKVLKKKKIDFEVVHGSRDYYHVVVGDVILELIPVVENKNPEKALNVTDFSLSHVKYVKKVLAKNPKLADEIKLAKAFCEAQKVYGAESYIRGFSGYALECLIINFGSFEKMLKGLVKANGKIVLDPSKQFKKVNEILFELNESKLLSPIVLVDPTYKFRNVCAGLSTETFEKFVDVAKSFLKKPSLDFFVKKEIDLGEMQFFALKNKAKLLELNFSTDRQAGDIAGTKMRKFFDFVSSEFCRRGQEVLRKEFYYSGKGQTAIGYFIVLENKEMIVKGPANWMRKEIAEFKKGKAKVVEKNGFVYGLEKTSIEKVLKFVKRFEHDMGAKLE